MAGEILYIPKFDDKHANAELRKKPGEWFWVRMPTNMDSLTRQRLVQTAAGRQAFAVYVHLVEVAAKDEPRGYLADERGPMTIQEIALKTAIPIAAIKASIKILTADSIGWIGNQTGMPPPVHQESNGNEIPGAVGHSNSNSDSDSSGGDARGGDRFEEFWSGVPTKVGKGAARKAWLAAIKRAEPSQIIAGLPGYAKYEQQRMKRDGNDYRPLHPSTWLNEERWTDEHGNDAAKQRREAAEEAERQERLRKQAERKAKAVPPPNKRKDSA